MQYGCFLTIIIPCYNEEARGRDEYPFYLRLDKLRDFLATFSKSHEVIFVTDGCTDNTVLELTYFISRYSLRNWRTRVLVDNVGKGAAIRKGIEWAKGQMVLFMDADLAVPLSTIDDFVTKGDAYSCVIGNRFQKKDIYYSPMRNFISKSSRLLTKPLLPVKVSDTQCGFKMFPRDVVLRNIELFRIDRWLFDVELLSVLMHSGIKIVEHPIIWNNLEASTVSNKAVIVSLKELLMLYLRKRVLRKKVQKNWK